MRILAALLVLNVLVMIHEFGHFIVAKLMGVKVNEFAIGMGPKLVSFGKKETVYSLRLLPIGGFCAMEGEDEGAPTPSALGGNSDRDVDDGEEGRSFAKKKVWQRLSIVVAGAAMNLLLGYVLLLVFNGFLLEKNAQGQKLLGTTQIHSVAENSAAYQTGLRQGDTILSINGRRILIDSDLGMAIANDADGYLQMVVRREENGKQNKVELESVMLFDTVEGKKTYGFSLVGVPSTLWNNIKYSAKQEVWVATLVWRTLVDLVKGNYGISDLSGPVGTVGVIADAVGDTVSTPNPLVAWQNLVFLMILITVNLGVFNLLPLPALDGGRLVFLVWEGITRKPVPQKFEAVVHFVGIVLLLLLMVFVTYSDITKLFV